MLKSFLMAENYEVIAVSDGESVCEKFFSDDFNLVLLDLMLPKRNGMEVLGKIRESSTVPILMISAKDTDSDKPLGLGLVADDYITKSFSMTEALAHKSQYQKDRPVCGGNFHAAADSYKRRPDNGSECLLREKRWQRDRTYGKRV